MLSVNDLAYSTCAQPPCAWKWEFQLTDAIEYKQHATYPFKESLVTHAAMAMWPNIAFATPYWPNSAKALPGPLGGG